MYYIVNHKRKYIIAGSILATILVIVLMVFFFMQKKEGITYSTVTATDHSFSIQVPSNIEYRINKKQDTTFTLDLYSIKEEMYLYASTIAKQRAIDLYGVVEEDKTSYLVDKENIREDTGIVETSINGATAYTYSFIYFDQQYGKDFYSSVLWIQTEKNLYLLNCEVVANEKNTYQDVFVKIQNSFQEL